MLPTEQEGLIVVILGVITFVAALLALGFGLIVGSSVEVAQVGPTTTISLTTPLPTRPPQPTTTPRGALDLPTAAPPSPTISSFDIDPGTATEVVIPAAEDTPTRSAAATATVGEPTVGTPISTVTPRPDDTDATPTPTPESEPTTAPTDTRVPGSPTPQPEPTNTPEEGYPPPAPPTATTAYP